MQKNADWKSLLLSLYTAPHVQQQPLVILTSSASTQIVCGKYTHTAASSKTVTRAFDAGSVEHVALGVSDLLRGPV